MVFWAAGTCLQFSVTLGTSSRTREWEKRSNEHVMEEHNMSNGGREGGKSVLLAHRIMARSGGGSAMDAGPATAHNMMLVARIDIEPGR